MLLTSLSPIGFRYQFPEIPWWQLNRVRGGIGQTDFSVEDTVLLEMGYSSLSTNSIFQNYPLLSLCPSHSCTS